MTAPLVAATDLLGVVDAELARRGHGRTALYEAMADRYGEKPDTHYKRIRRAEQAGGFDVGHADRVLVALDLGLDDLPDRPAAPRLRGDARLRGGYLTEQQVLACHALYQQGVSLRGIAERILPRTEFTSATRCAESLRRRFARMGLTRRPRGGVVTHGQAVGHGHGRTRNDYLTAWKRANGHRPAVRCEATTAAGSPCRAWAVHGAVVCRKHQPAEAAA
ncbi:MAG: hypothetical protein AB7G65_19885 [Thermoleophilia bacterium]